MELIIGIGIFEVELALVIGVELELSVILLAASCTKGSV